MSYVEQFRNSYPQFSHFHDDKIEMLLSAAFAETPANIWLDKQILGVMLLTAHRLQSEIQQISVMASDAANVSAGGRVSFSIISFDEMSLTIFGKQYETLKKGLPISGFPF